MGYDHIEQTIAASALGGGIDAGIARKASKLHVELDQKILDCNDHLAELKAASQDIKPSPGAVSDLKKSQIGATASSAVSQLETAGENKQAAENYRRQFQLLHSLTRPPIHPDATMSLMIFAIFAVFEGAMTALVFLGGGHVAGVPEALGLGLTISGANILLSGIIGGNIAGKYWNYGSEAIDDNPKYKHVRIAGRTASITVCMLVICLLLLSGIVRSTGTTQISYSLESLTVAVSDFHSIILWVLGGNFAVLSWFKGLRAFSDPYPNYSDATHAENTAQQSIEAIHDDALGELDRHYNDAINAIQGMADEVTENARDVRKGIQETHGHREAVLSEISKADVEFSAFVAKQIEVHEIVTGARLSHSATPHWGIDINRLKDRIAPVEVDISKLSAGFTEERKQAFHELLIARQSAIEKVDAAYKAAMKPKSQSQGILT